MERKAREMVELQANQPKVISRELWDHLQQLPPRTPFESRIARDNARIRTGDPLSMVCSKFDQLSPILIDVMNFRYCEAQLLCQPVLCNCYWLESSYNDE